MSLDHSIRPGVACPPTVLVIEMGDGSYLIQAYPTGPAAYINTQDSRALRDALDTAFGAGRTMDIPPIVKPRV